MHDDDAIEAPVAIVTTPPPGGALPGGEAKPFIQPVDGISADLVGKISHDYINTTAKVDDMAVQYGLTTRDVRKIIKTYGLDKQKNLIIQQMQGEELARYSKFLDDNRVDTAQQHLEISNKVNQAVDKLLDAAAGKTPEELSASVKDLKAIASLYRSLSETLGASSNVGARAVALTGISPDQGGFGFAGSKGKKPLVSLSFNVTPGADAPIPVQDAEFTEG